MEAKEFISTEHEVIHSASLIDAEEITISREDCDILRRLAAQASERMLAADELKKRDLQRRRNSLEWVRPLVMCFPEVSWREIIPEYSLICHGNVARSWETKFRHLLFIADMKSDQCLTQSFESGYLHSDLDWGITMKQEGDLTHGSYRWEAPIQSEADIDKLCAPVMYVDFEASDALQSLAEDTFGDLLPISRKESWYWTTGLTQTLIYLRGLEQMMLDMMDRPDFVHLLMGRLRDGTMAFLKDLEEKQLLFPNWDISYCGSGGIGLTDELPEEDFDGVIRLKDQWGFSESQETVGVSPRMFNQFILPYQKPLLELFGLTYYGCCEPVDQRWKYLKEIPNLRRLSVSPWSSREKMVQYLGQDYIYCLKPNPAVMARETLPEDEIRAYTRETLEIAGECHLEFILKDVTTVRNEPERIHRWVKIVKEEIERFYSSY